MRLLSRLRQGTGEDYQSSVAFTSAPFSISKRQMSRWRKYTANNKGVPFLAQRGDTAVRKLDFFAKGDNRIEKGGLLGVPRVHISTFLDQQTADVNVAVPSRQD